MSTETELKLAADGVTAEQISALPMVQAGLRRTLPARHLGNVYFDTPDGLLQRRRIGLRLRRDGEQWLQTVKTSGSGSSGLHRRGEWEMPVAGEALELDRFDAPQLQELFAAPGLREGLGPVFRTDFQRTTWELAFADGAAIEMVLDLGEIVAGDRREPISEVELELKSSGDAVRLFALADALAARLPMRVLNASKAERGYRLGGRAEPYAAVEVGSVVLDPEVSAEQALGRVLHQCLDGLQANEAVLAARPDDVEAARQAWSAARRLRVALDLYPQSPPRSAGDQAERETATVTEVDTAAEQLGDPFGPPRDWDWIIAQTLGPLLRDDPDDRGLAALAGAAETRRAQACRAASAALRSSDHTRRLLRIGGWLEARAWRGGLTDAQRAVLDGPAAAFAAAALDGHHQRLRALGERFAELDPAGRDRLRAHCESLRYVAEACAELFGRGAALAYAAAAAAAQHALDRMHGGETAAALLAQLDSRDDCAARERVLSRAAAGVRDAEASFAANWNAFIALPRFWE